MHKLTIPLAVVMATTGTLLLSSLGNPVGTQNDRRVIVLGIDDDGRAQIEPEQNIYNTEE